MTANKKETLDSTYFYAVSNGSEHIFPNNTLSHFHNILPKMLINMHNKYEIGLSEIMLDAKFKCRVLPEEHIPTLILSKLDVPPQDSDITTEYFKYEYPIHIPHHKMSLLKLIMYLYTYQSEISGRTRRPYILSWVQKYKQYCFGCFDDLKGKPTSDGREYKLYVHTRFNQFIQAEFKSEHAQLQSLNYIGTRQIDNEPYHVYEYLSNTTIFFACNTSWTVLPSFYQPTIFIETNCIDGQIYNQKVKKQIGFSNVPNNDYTQHITYFYKEFEAVQFYPLKISNFDKLEIKLVDIEGNQIRLLPGRATLVKFILRPRRTNMSINKHFINVSSKKETGISKDNTESNFKVQLPRPINLYGRWRATILAAIFPSQFKLELTEFERALIIHIFPTATDSLKYALVLPNVNSIEEIANYIENKTDYNIEVEIDAITGGLSLTSKFHVKYQLNAALFYFLGGIQPETDTVNILTLERARDQAVTFHRPPRFEQHWPSTVFVYADFIKHSIVGGEMMKTIKIIPIVSRNIINNTYLQHEWKTLEWHEINNSVLHTLHFELRGQGGDLIQFNNKPDDENYTWFKIVIEKAD